MNNPNLFDLNLLRSRQKKSINKENYDNFLHREVGERLTNRIKDVNKNFEKTIQNLTDTNISDIEKITADKEKEISQI